MKKLIVGGLLSVLAAGCISINQNDGGYAINSNPVAKDIVHEKLTVENKQVSATDKIHCLFGFITWGSSATHHADVSDATGPTGRNKAKNGAYANACDAAGCDQLVATRYKVKVTDYFVYAQYEAEVKGYPAKVVGVETVENKDPSVCCKPAGNALKLPF